LGTTLDHAMHLRHTHLFWISIIVVALILTLFLKETGAATQAALRPSSKA
jgi:hypothetical protein